MLKVAGSDAAAVNALTPDQVRGKVLLLDFPEGTNPMMLTRQLPGLAARACSPRWWCCCAPAASRST
jgi:hypothetical protein